jgi:site-specific DNA-methyltransferase (adenine-specific)
MSVGVLQGDAVTVLREQIAPRSIDMIYSDPPFGNEQIWTGVAGTFSDKWRWSEQSAKGWERLRQHSAIGVDLMAAATPTAKGRAYIGMMAGLLLSCHDALKLTGSLWLHFDDTMGAHLRLLGDVIFGPENQIGTVVWKRGRGKNSCRHFGRNHDTIACFGRSRAARAKLWRIGSRDLVHGGFDHPVYVDALLDDLLGAGAKERVGYPTQKPIALIRRFILAATVRGDVVLDPTCGSGTSLVAALQEGRIAIGIDVSEAAVTVARERTRPPSVEQLDLFARAA